VGETDRLTDKHTDIHTDTPTDTYIPLTFITTT